MLEDVEAAGEGAVPPQPFQVALGAVVGDVLHDQAFQFQVSFGQQGGCEHILQRYQPPFGVDVADDQGQVAPRGEEGFGVAVDFEEFLQEGFRVRAIAQVVGVVSEPDDVVVRGMQDDEMHGG